MKKLPLTLSLCLLLCSCGTLQADIVTDNSGTAAVSQSVSAALPQTEDTFSNGCNIELGSTINVHGIGAIVDGGCVNITEGGIYTISGLLEDGMIYINSEETVKIVLNGAAITNKSGAAIFSGKGKLIIESAEGSQNFLNGGSYTYERSFESKEDNEPNAAVFSNNELILSGGGKLTVNASEGNGISTKDGLTLNGCTLDITAADNGIKGKASITAENADITVNSGGKGISANGDVTINSGNISVTNSTEGIESKALLTINGGNVSIISSDDGLNAGGGKSTDSGNEQQTDEDNTEHAICINGGFIYINAEGDGIDSNGNIMMTGGNVVVCGPVSDGNAPLDYDGSMKISGGTVLALGSTGMLSVPESSYIGTASLNASAGTIVTAADSAGNVIASVVLPKQAQGVLFCRGEATDGITLYTGGTLSDTADKSGVVLSGTITGGTAVETSGVLSFGGRGGGFGRPQMPGNSTADGGNPPQMPENGFGR